MDLRDYLRAIRRRWWLVVGSVVLALAAATLVTVLTPPRYEASVQFFVSAQTKGGVTDAYQGDLFSQQRVASYVDLLTSDRLARSRIMPAAKAVPRYAHHRPPRPPVHDPSTAAGAFPGVQG